MSVSVSGSDPDSLTTSVEERFAVLNVAKPKGMTSHDVVARVRRVFGLKRVGHLGTLDPMAEGVLPVCLGRATRLIEYFPTDKRYRAWVTFGKTTHTLDAEGEVLTEQSAAHLTEEAVKAQLAAFTGTFSQQVPLHAAVRVNGKKLYQYAHAGRTDVVAPSREVTIHALSLAQWQEAVHSPEANGAEWPTAVLEVHCSSGTYIRALARDLGEALGTGAYLSRLVRTAHGAFTLDSAVALDALQQSSSPQNYLQNPLPFLALPVLVLADTTRQQALLNGINLPVTEQDGPLKANQWYLAVNQPDVTNPETLLLAVLQHREHRLRPHKVFNVRFAATRMPPD
ncbi:MAG: tRNA pseudouridine(55) synthase TruB [Candidatus Melainabacteria bacterium]|nr:tRNA pseudouridine(55) synthase TruB [Candidatus Melainabacteria bacterium]